MKLLVCGPRDWTNLRFVFDMLTRWHTDHNDPLAEIVAGDAKGVDAFALQWAEAMHRPWARYEAKWRERGPSAGPLRNERMLTTSRPHWVLAFKYTNEEVTKGTLDMVTRAVRAGVSVEFFSCPRSVKKPTLANIGGYEPPPRPPEPKQEPHVPFQWMEEHQRWCDDNNPSRS